MPVLLFFFILWLSLISDTFLMQFVCRAFSSRTMAKRRSRESAKINSKHTLCCFLFFFPLFLNNHRRGTRASLIENVLFLKWWETKWPLSVGRKLLLRLICMAPHVSAIVIMGANEFLC